MTTERRNHGRSAVVSAMLGSLMLANMMSASAFVVDKSLPISRSRILGRSDISNRAVTTNLPLSTSPSDSSAAAILKRKPKKGDIVTIDFSITPEAADFVPQPLFDTSGEVTFVLHGGNYLPGLHDLVATMSPGESVENASLDAGWGERKDELLAKVPKSGQDGLDYDKIAVGVELIMGGNGARCTVTEVTDDDFTIDANPPLAGASYSADVKLLRVEEGPHRVIYREDGHESEKQNGRYDIATFALGCFWGGELAYMRVPGVVGTKVGYTQGNNADPTYEQVCSGTTGHTEAIQVVYDPTIVDYEHLVKLGMHRLDDSKYLLNQVGTDKGTQYRHGVYYHSSEQRDVARGILDSFGECVTELEPATVFFDAEDYHQQYLLKGGQSAKKGDEESIRCYG